jgi:hypothetical protein
MEGALWQGRFIHIPLSIRAKTPTHPLSGIKESSKKFFYSLEFVDIKSRRRYGRVSYEESVGEEDRESGRDRVCYCTYLSRNDHRTLG